MSPRGTESSEHGGALAEVLEGLAQPRKHLPCKLFYDERGSQLFESICELDEYYLTRTELAIMRASAGEMARCMGPHALLIELGSGSSVKVRLLLDQLVSPSGYVPIDISTRHLLASARALAKDYPDLPVLPVSADYMQPIELPELPRLHRRRVAYFPGSTIGNLRLEQAVAFMRGIAKLVGRGGAMLIGADLKKDRRVLERAYNDAAGVTAEFNLNLLHVLNLRFQGDFVPSRFEHLAVYDEVRGRIEMRLISKEEQRVHVSGQPFDLAKDEWIVTEYSHKYSLAELAALAEAGGMQVRKIWTDPLQRFSVQYLEVL